LEMPAVTERRWRLGVEAVLSIEIVRDIGEAVAPFDGVEDDWRNSADWE